MDTKLARMVIYLDRLLIIKSCKALISDQMILQGHVANKNHHISITRVSMATKLDTMIASLDGLLPIMSHDPFTTWPCEIRGSLTGGGSAQKRLSRHRLLVILYIWRDKNVSEKICFKENLRNLKKTMNLFLMQCYLVIEISFLS